MRAAIESLPGSRIREVANAGLGRDDVLAFWFGESDEVTPEVVRNAAARSLQQGETFYSHNLGLADLRAGIAAYQSALHGPIDVDRIAVTSSGVSALMIAMQMLAGAGDEVVAVVPVWPNLTAQPAILGANVVRVPLRPQHGLWQLDLDELCAAVTGNTKVLLINAPNNPTGWTLTRPEQEALLAHCRRTGTWIIADEVYERIWFGGGPAAPSFLDVAAPDDRLLVAHSFSKSFLMTGWRLGWLVVPPGHLDVVGRLLEFNSSCAPVFAQRGAQAALGIADELRSGPGRPPAGRARPLDPRTGVDARGHGGGAAGRHVRLLPGRRPERLAGLCQGPRARCWPGSGAGNGLRPGGRRLAALVFRFARPGAPRCGPATAVRRAWSIISGCPHWSQFGFPTAPVGFTGVREFNLETCHARPGRSRCGLEVSRHPGNPMTMTTAEKAQLIKDHARGAADTGSPEVQVAICTARINELTPHFKEHKKDHHGRRGLLKLVNQRKRLLSYLKRNDADRYTALIAKLGLRK